MICPNCGNKINPKYDICDDCNFDLSDYRKIYQYSNMYYNSGLKKAQVRDLTGAVCDLKQSLALYKENSDARNLLALVYYEMGEIVEALSQWLISKHLDPVDNEADYFIALVHDSTTELDDMNQAIKKYNRALEEVKQDNMDMAVISLRKAITVHPKFLRAIRLLTLLYIDQGEISKAAKLIRKGLDINKSDGILLAYRNEISQELNNENENENLENEAESILKRRSGSASGFSYKEDRPNIMVFVNLVIGVLIGIAVVYYLFIPTIKERLKEEYESQKVDYSAELAAKSATITQNEKTIASLNKKISDLENSLDSNNKAAENSKNKTASYSDFFACWETFNDLKSRVYTEDELVALAYKIWKIDSDTVTDIYAMNLLKSMREEVYSLASEKVYKTAKNLFDQEMYGDAVNWLSAAADMDPSSDKAVYYLGKTYQALEQYEEAIDKYNMVLEINPVSTLKEYIPLRLKECEEALGTTE